MRCALPHHLHRRAWLTAAATGAAALTLPGCVRRRAQFVGPLMGHKTLVLGELGFEYEQDLSAEARRNIRDAFARTVKKETPEISWLPAAGDDVIWVESRVMEIYDDREEDESGLLVDVRFLLKNRSTAHIQITSFADRQDFGTINYIPLGGYTMEHRLEKAAEFAGWELGDYLLAATWTQGR
jgi:hypothetical protein